MKLDARLTKGKSKEDVAELIDRFRNSTSLRKDLAEVLTNEIEACILREEGEDVLSSPNALAKIASLYERRKALRFALNLIDPEL